MWIPTIITPWCLWVTVVSLSDSAERSLRERLIQKAKWPVVWLLIVVMLRHWTCKMEVVGRKNFLDLCQRKTMLCVGWAWLCSIDTVYLDCCCCCLCSIAENMNAAMLSSRIMRLFVQRASTCHQVLQQCSISTSSVAAQVHTSLHQFTDDERMMRDTGECLLLAAYAVELQCTCLTYCVYLGCSSPLTESDGQIRTMFCCWVVN